MGIAKVIRLIFHVVRHGHFWALSTHGAVGVQMRASRVFAIVAAPSRVTSFRCICKISLFDVSGPKLGDGLMDLALRAFFFRNLIKVMHVSIKAQWAHR